MLIKTILHTAIFAIEYTSLSGTAISQFRVNTIYIKVICRFCTFVCKRVDNSMFRKKRKTITCPADMSAGSAAVICHFFHTCIIVDNLVFDGPCNHATAVNDMP